MDSNQPAEAHAIRALTALGQDTRLRVFRELVRHAHNGLTAGEIAERAGVLPNTLSSNLSILANAGLIRSEREGRHVRYFVELPGLRGLVTYLVEECCGGRPGDCAALFDSLCCDPGQSGPVAKTCCA
ncbi:ArsR/SmtB family transcription factor [Paracoccus zhejiangensis]|uniref:Transcriptional regulator n=1 Tax=Paracoccus zhejiangensis TaxID=1077935 RepID=A0A2H5F288_9RHOB|nr:winged helix-turn-helix domain-containing protein [Paracoccus zhejiangensis]AUH65642.1 transcriptional regulator [Paracoccus zhejiangensis]